jgi:phospholipid/cholesterol/gamma-HCH transport system substrate-binding protein
LKVGSNIRFSGINVGTVDNIKIINDSTVQVDLLIKKSVQQFIKEDCQAAIGSAGIIGDKILVISQGSDAASIVRDGQHMNPKSLLKPMPLLRVYKNRQLVLKLFRISLPK